MPPKLDSDQSTGYVIRDDRGRYYMGQDLEGHWWCPDIAAAGVYTERAHAVEAAGRLNIDMAACKVDAVCEAVALDERQASNGGS